MIKYVLGSKQWYADRKLSALGGEEVSSPRWQYLEVSWTQRWREAESPVQGFVFVFVFVFIIYIDTQECTQSFSSFPTHDLVFCPFVLPYFHNFSPYI